MEREAEDLIRAQVELHGRISRMVDNLKKMGQANNTTGAVQSRTTTLEKYWAKFEEQHETLRTTYREVTKNHDYVKKDLSAILEETYLN
ncbi:hypothetical protein RF55_12430 [Lasius niger]|uniref:Uncharacterized protein n=1 Tax=Lasius niger TaxID=67767 RepID=A0A0J7KCT4_LASNI|nr:hypothetical protein RF55_12430 [Lasius niger]